MIRTFIFLALLISGTWSSAQNVLIIEKKSDNQALFDEGEPYSLFSVLKKNLGILGYYDLQGMEEDKVAELRARKLDQGIVRFVYPYTSDEPLKNANGGDSVIVIDGFTYYVYVQPDTLYADLDNITTITIEFDDKKPQSIDKASRINFWKKYPGDDKLTRTFSSEARDLLKLDGFKQVVKLEDAITEKITDLTNPNSLWSVMKDSALLDMRRQWEIQDNSDFDIGIYNEQQRILPDRDEFYWNSIGLRFSDRVYEMGVLQEMQTFCEDDSPIDKKPFITIDSARIEGASNFNLMKDELNTIEFVIYQPKSPLIEDDYDSPDFGYEKIVYDENGVATLVYPEPEQVYFWVDYDNPQLFLTEDIVYHETGNTSITRIEQVYLTKQIGEGKPTLISYFSLKEEFRAYFINHSKTILTNMEWYKVLGKSVKSRKGRLDLSKKCHLKKYKKRFQTLN